MDDKLSIVDSCIELKFRPKWKYIACTRKFIQNFLAIITDQIKAYKVAMAVSELLENAVRYTSGENAEIRIHVSQETENISISIENKASAESIDNLRQVFNKVIQGDPLKVYMSQMKEAVSKNDSKGQLGLARIRYETGCDLNLSVKDNLVRMSMNVK